VFLYKCHQKETEVVLDLVIGKGFVKEAVINQVTFILTSKKKETVGPMGHLDSLVLLEAETMIKDIQAVFSTTQRNLLHMGPLQQ
jgi:hypothetical protein